ncbi:hypothetical protein GE09DRAFT_1252067 [Coniochaeta sp. 2T2.1]|nr:hypothetical protein GE09DRAFT_1252067 [Coniochaeta sp. 2T2.1]
METPGTPEQTGLDPTAPEATASEALPVGPVLPILFGSNGAAAAAPFSFGVTHPPDVTTTVFDPDGELRLDIGPYSLPVLSCVVCPRTISRASNVFKRMLYGGFSESKPKEGEWVVKLPEDDPDAMTFVLYILHGHFDKVPRTLTQDKLYRVTVVTDKYDLTSSLRPWASMWLQNPEAPESRNMLANAQRIRIAWELGDTELFKYEANDILRHAPEELFKSTSLEAPGVDILESLGLVEPMKKARVPAITALLDPVKELLDSLFGVVVYNSAERPRQCKVWKNSHLVNETHACDAMVLTSALNSLHTRELYPLPEPASVNSTIRQLYKRLDAAAKSITPLQTRPWRRVGSARSNCRNNCTEHSPCEKCCEESSDHSQCSPGPELQSALAKAYNSPAVVLEEWHTAHLDAQAAKTRLPVSD